jgi:uncharacterized membrane protein
VLPDQQSSDMSLFRKKELFTEAQKERLMQAVREAEKLTSGEIRLFVESHCAYVNPADRAMEIFASLKMEETKYRNGVLIYVALKDRQYAIYGDAGIHARVGNDFWLAAAKSLEEHFRDGRVTEGLEHCIRTIALSLGQHFPYEEGDQNELPDDIVFGK